jgi:magnesium chelatase subunit H
MRESGRAEQITATIIETARQCNLDKDVALPADDEAAKKLSMDERDLVIGNVYRCASCSLLPAHFSSQSPI